MYVKIDKSMQCLSRVFCSKYHTKTPDNIISPHIIAFINYNLIVLDGKYYSGRYDVIQTKKHKKYSS